MISAEVVDLRECDQYLFTLRQIVLLIIPAMLAHARTLLLHRGVTDVIPLSSVECNYEGSSFRLDALAFFSYSIHFFAY